jgi:hypothetical protein
MKVCSNEAIYPDIRIFVYNQSGKPEPMKEKSTLDIFPVADSTIIIPRLTALWAFSEAGLGGIMHAFKSPFTGIFVGGIAVVLISLIAYFADRKAMTILKATAIVLIVKGIVSPHSPLFAYFAVGFQGLAGAFIFSILNSFRPAALILGVVALGESALQKILTLTLIYGTSLWESIDLFLNYVLQTLRLSDPAQGFPGSTLLISLYLGLYVLSGVLVGLLAGVIPVELTRIPKHQNAEALRQSAAIDQDYFSAPLRHRPIWRKDILKFSMVLVGMIAIFIIINPELKGAYRAVYVLIRACIAIAAWYFVAAPLLTRLLSFILTKKRKVYFAEVEQILSILPQLRRAAVVLWKSSAHFPLLKRLRYFLLTLIYYSLICEPAGIEKDKNAQTADRSNS